MRAALCVQTSPPARPLPGPEAPGTITGRMSRAAHMLALAAVFGLPCGPASGAEEVSSPEWGEAVAGLQVSLAADATPTVGGTLRFRVALRNTNAAPAPLGPAERLCGWLLVAQKWGDARRGFYSVKVRLRAPDWPTQLAAGGTIAFDPVDLSASDAWPTEAARELLSAYLAVEDEPQQLPKPAGKLAAVLSPGRAAAKFTLALPTPGGKPLLLASNSLALIIRPPDLDALGPEAREAFLADLLGEFNRNAWAAREAHNTAVQLGPTILPRLIAAVDEPDRPDFARMWLATAIADLPDPRAVAALVRLLDEKKDCLDLVVAYHGPKQNDAQLDAAIAEKVRASRDGRLTALATLGYLVWRGGVPEPILAASLESDDPRTRAAAVEALSQYASPFNVERLIGLLADGNERVRGAAASVLGNLGVRSAEVVGALVAALDLEGETARQRIAAALADLTGHDWPYDPKADAAARDAALKAWRDWWAKNNPKRD